MGFFDRFKKRATEIVDFGSIGLSDTLLQALLNPDSITVDKAMEIPAFAGCVNKICDTAALVPIRLYQRTKDKVEEVEDDRVRLINDDTGDTLSGADFKKAMMFDYLTNRGGYAYINRRGRWWKSLNYVEASKVSFAESIDPIFKDYQIYVDGKSYYPHQFIKFIRRTTNGYKGKSIIAENALLLSVAYNTMIFENGNVKKGGSKKGFLQSERKLDQDSIDTLRNSYKKMYSNEGESVVVLNNGIKFQEASMTSVELQLNENKKQNDTEICKIFDMPPAILSGGATAQDWTSFVQYCILTKMDTLCDALGRDLLLEEEKKKGYFFAPDASELMKADIKTRFEAWGAGIKSGFLQIDEAREKENLPALNFPFLKLGLQDVLYDPKTETVYTPNTGLLGSVKGGQVQSTGKGLQASPAPQGQDGDLNQSTKGEESDDPGKEQSHEGNS